MDFGETMTQFLNNNGNIPHNTLAQEQSFRLNFNQFLDKIGSNFNDIERKMMDRVMKIDEYLWERSSEGGLTTGLPLLDKAMDNDIFPGLYLIAAAPNTGKSALLLQIARNIGILNKNVHVAYHAFDDNDSEITPRYIACAEKITISQAKNPARYKDDSIVMNKRNNALKELYMNANQFTLWDANDGVTLTDIENRIKDLKMTYGDEKRLIICLDSIYDLVVEGALSDKQVAETIARTVKGWCKTYNIAIFATAHLKKTGGRRPTMEDLKESNRLEFETNFALLLYNEVGLKEEESDIYWVTNESEEKMPVIEARVGKNKFGSFKGTIFYEFIPDFSFSNEVPLNESYRYVSLMAGE